jgi:hypothetical protein
VGCLWARAGSRLRLSVVAHKQGATIGSLSSRAGLSPLSVYLWARNSVHYTRRNHPAFLAPALAMLLFHSARFLAAGAFGNFGFAIRGIADGCLGKTGRPDPKPANAATVRPPSSSASRLAVAPSRRLRRLPRRSRPRIHGSSFF